MCACVCGFAVICVRTLQILTLCPIMPRQTGARPLTAVLRRNGRPRLQLHLDDVQPTTLARYDRMLAQLNSLMSLLGSVSLDMLFRAQAVGAIQIWVMLLMQVHFDAGTAGLSDIGNLLSGLSRSIRLATWTGASSVISPESVMRPLWKAFSHWKKVEPYEFRCPLPRFAVQGLMGICLAAQRLHLLLFICLCHHCCGGEY